MSKRLVRNAELNAAAVWIAKLLEAERLSKMTARQRLAEALSDCGPLYTAETVRPVLSDAFSSERIKLFAAIAEISPWPVQPSRTDFQLVGQVDEVIDRAATEGRIVKGRAACREVKRKHKAQYKGVENGALNTRLIRARERIREWLALHGKEQEQLDSLRRKFGHWLPLDKSEPTKYQDGRTSLMRGVPPEILERYRDPRGQTGPKRAD